MFRKVLLVSLNVVLYSSVAFGSWWLFSTFGMIFVWVLAGIAAASFGVWLYRAIGTILNGIEVFEQMIGRFVEVNQDFYETQEKIIKKQNDVSKRLNDDLLDVAIIRRHTTALENATKNLADIAKVIRETTKTNKTATDELKVSRDIATNLAEVSKNIKILDRVAVSMKRTTEELKRG